VRSLRESLQWYRAGKLLDARQYADDEWAKNKSTGNYILPMELITGNNNFFEKLFHPSVLRFCFCRRTTEVYWIFPMKQCWRVKKV
jgi:hypothetical protein